MPTPTLSALLDRHLETNVAKDIAYTSEQKMDIYSPITPGDWPIVVVLHGGGSTKSEVQGISQAIAQRGAVVFAPKYRSSEPLLPSDTITQGPEDAACAVRFARAKAAGYGTKPTPRLILVGHSAGGAIGMTVMLAGDDFKGDCLVNEGSALPDAFVGLDGAYDILSLNSPDNFKKSAYGAVEIDDAIQLCGSQTHSPECFFLFVVRCGGWTPPDGVTDAPGFAGGRLPILSGFSSGCGSWDDG